MKYNNTVKAKFVERLNRFVAIVEVDGHRETVHVKNTGRCKELLLPGATVVLTKSDNLSRKTQYDLVAVFKQGFGWINIDSQAPNIVVKDWLSKGNEVFPKITLLKPEYSYGRSRVDFYLECEEKKILMEVKGCTLEVEGIGYFPDAPTERGVKHLRELQEASKQGYDCYIAFFIPMPGVKVVYPNTAMHPEFGVALKDAEDAGVKVLYLQCSVTPDELIITKVDRKCS